MRFWVLYVVGMAKTVINFALTDADRRVIDYLERRTGITSSSQLVRLVLREAAEGRGWVPQSLDPPPTEDERATG